jgi:hypothetical protein
VDAAEAEGPERDAGAVEREHRAEARDNQHHQELAAEVEVPGR